METHNAVVMGRIEKKKYICVESWGGVKIVKELKNLVEHQEIWRGELENPPLNTNDYLYINNIDLKVGITDKAKSTEGGYVYWTDYVIDLIEDEETKESKIKAEEELEQFKKLVEQYEEERQKKKEAENAKNNKKWYQFWK